MPDLMTKLKMLKLTEKGKKVEVEGKTECQI